MVFSSHLFLFYFLPAALALYYLSPRRLKHLTLAAVSYVFYGWASPLFVVLMFASTLIVYLCGLALAGQFRVAFLADLANNPTLAGLVLAILAKLEGA